MGFLLNSYRYGSGIPPRPSTDIPYPTPILLANRNSAQTLATDGAVSWNVETYDPTGVIAVTSTTVTIGTTALYRISYGSLSNGGGHLKTRIGGTELFGGPAQSGDTGTVTNPQVSAAGGIVSLTASNSLTLTAYTANNYGGDGKTWICLEKIDSSTKYALVRKNANQTVTSGTITFQTEIADTDAFHDTSSNTDRLTVPSGVTRVRLTANLVCNNSPAVAEVKILKNGTSEVVGMPARRRNQTTHKLMNLITPPVNVTTGDYFQVQADFASSSSVLNEAGTTFGIEQIPSGTGSALVYNAGTYVVTTTPAAVAWDSEDHDTESIHSTSSNTSRLTAPAWATYGRAFFYIKGQLNSTDRMAAEIRKNGSVVVGSGSDSGNGASGAYQRLTGVTAWVPITSGDYFELFAGADASVTCTGGWFAAEFI